MNTNGKLKLSFPIPASRETSIKMKRLSNLALIVGVFLICFFVFFVKQSKKSNGHANGSFLWTKECLVEGNWVAYSNAKSAYSLTFSKNGDFYTNSAELFENNTNWKWSIVKHDIIQIESTNSTHGGNLPIHYFKMSSCNHLQYKTIEFKKK